MQTGHRLQMLLRQVVPQQQSHDRFRRTLDQSRSHLSGDHQKQCRIVDLPVQPVVNRLEPALFCPASRQIDAGR
ncbi:hypothetical protein D3C78_1751920 [compost metagenome]